MPKESIWKWSRPRSGQSGFWGTCQFLPCARMSRLVHACKVDSCLRSRSQRNCSCRAWSTGAFCSSTHTCALRQWSSMAWYLDSLPCLLKIIPLCRWSSEDWEDTTGNKLLPRQLLALGRPRASCQVGKHCLCRLQQELLLAGLGGESPAQKGLFFVFFWVVMLREGLRRSMSSLSLTMALSQALWFVEIGCHWFRTIPWSLDVLCERKQNFGPQRPKLGCIEKQALEICAA